MFSVGEEAAGLSMKGKGATIGADRADDNKLLHIELPRRKIQ